MVIIYIIPTIEWDHDDNDDDDDMCCRKGEDIESDECEWWLFYRVIIVNNLYAEMLRMI